MRGCKWSKFESLGIRLFCFFTLEVLSDRWGTVMGGPTELWYHVILYNMLL